MAGDKAMEVDQKDTSRANKVDLEKVTADINAAKALAAQGKLPAAIEALLNIEKQQRLAENVASTRTACNAILELLFQAKEYTQLREHIMLLSKRRSQLKQVVQAFVRQAMGYMDQLPSQGEQVELIKTLQAVTEGKIYVEIERARLTRRLATMREAEGNIAEAADILQEVAVETFGAMAKTEKIHYILEQVRLCLLREDYARAQILLRKVSPRAFVDVDKKGTNTGEVGIEGSVIEAPEEGTPTIQQLKVCYYELSIEYNGHNNNYLEMARNYRAIYETPEVSADEALWAPVLKKICWLVVMAPADSDQVTLLQLTKEDKKLASLPLYKQLLDSFTQQEILWYRTFESSFAKELAEQDLFKGPKGESRTSDLRLRVTERNILVIAKYYSRLQMARFAELLDLSPQQAESHLADLVVARKVVAKVDRPAGLVRFQGRQKPEQVLDTWARNIAKLLDLVEKSCQQIQKESMVHKVPIGSGAV